MKPLDVVVVGGGIAGLWTLVALRQSGFNAILIEQHAIGSGQTLASQGIIHGGTKYALTGKLTGSSEAVRSMPERWKQHLAGERMPDLSFSRINTPHQWMWDAGSVSSRVSSFFASKVMSSRVESLVVDQRPDFLKDKNIYQLQEPVLDIKSVLTLLARPYAEYLLRAEVNRHYQQDGHVVIDVTSGDTQQSVHARSVVFCAGAGNEGIQSRQMQLRPLQMLLVKGELPELWGHVIEANANPRLTITSHQNASGEIVWYIGGQLAEDGASENGMDLIERSKQELQATFPTLDWQAKQWATLLIDRAEGWQEGGKRPDEPVIKTEGKSITVWPTKLVFAPLVGDRVVGMINEMGIEAGKNDIELPDLPLASIGEYPWDEVEWVS